MSELIVAPETLEPFINCRRTMIRIPAASKSAQMFDPYLNAVVDGEITGYLVTLITEMDEFVKHLATELIPGALWVSVAPDFRPQKPKEN